MAFGMKHWLGAVAASLAIAVVWLVPPSAELRIGRRVRPAEDLIAERYQNSVIVANEALKRIRWTDSLFPLVAGTPRGEIFVAAPPGLTEKARATFTEAVEEELEALDAPGSDVRLGFVVQPRGQDGYVDAPMPSPWSLETYIGEHDGTTYCLQLFPDWATDRSDASLLRYAPWWDSPEYATATNLLAACRLVVRYGLPGPEIARWLGAGGLALAHFPTLPRQEVREAVRTQLSEDLVPLRTSRWIGGSVEGQRCAAGVADACRDLIREPGRLGAADALDLYLAEATPLSGSYRYKGGSPFLFLDESLLADVEAEFGRERFAEFWTSDEPFEEAFRTAFGNDVGDWMTGWARGWMWGSVTAGPRLSESARNGGLLAIAFFLGIATVWARRRRVA